MEVGTTTTIRKSAGFPSDLLIDLRSAGPRRLSERLEQDLRAAIQAGRLAGGAAVPPSRVLADELGISRTTVLRAYGNLVADGYLEARRGSGTRVRAVMADAEARTTGVAERPELLDDPQRSLLDVRAPIRLLGGLTDPTLFPRVAWARHYRAALASLPDRELGYPDARGAAPLRSALHAYLGRVRGVATVPDRVVVCAGATHGLNLLCRVLRRLGARRIAVEDPCFAPHRDVIAMSGLTPLPIAVDAGGLDVAALTEVDVDAVLVAPAHSFPTGGMLDVKRRSALIAWACKRGALVIEDDYDAELRYDRMPVGALQGHAPDHVAYLGSASKTLSAGLRLGWIVSPPQLIDALARETRHDSLGHPLLEQLAFARFVERGDFARHLRRLRPVYRRRRDAAIAALGEHMPDALWQGASAGLHLYVGLPDHIDEHALVRAAFARGVLLENASRHFADPRTAPPAVVLGYGSVGEATMRRALATVADALADPGVSRTRQGAVSPGPSAGP